MDNFLEILLFMQMIPPKFIVANTIGFLKGKSAIRIFREYLQVKQTSQEGLSGLEATVLVRLE